jgi:hypothetical protein
LRRFIIHRQVKNAMRGKISRRDAIKGGLAGVLASLFPACGSGGSSSSGTPTPSGNQWSATKYQDPGKNQMALYFNGSDNGDVREAYFQHALSSSMPDVALFDASGNIYLKPLRAGILFGANAVLGPAYWRVDPSGDSYQSNPAIDKMEITGSFASGPLDFKLTGKVGDQATPDFNVEWLIRLYEPQLNGYKTIIDVTQTATCARNITLSGTKQAEFRHFMPAVLRSMYVDSDTHDSNAVRYVKSDDTLVNKNISDMLASGVLFDGLTPSFKVGEMTHTDDSPDTPNKRLILVTPSIPAEHQWQGYDTVDYNPANRNVEAGFCHKTAPLAWSVGDKHIAYYRIIASDNPLDPSMPDTDPV